MKSKKLIISMFLIFITITFVVIVGCVASGTPEEEEPSTDLDVYGGSNPVGDFVVIEINKTDQKLKYHNYTKDEHTGWFDYAKVTDPAENMGFDIIYKVDVNADTTEDTETSYVLFAEFNDVALVYVPFNYLGDAIDNPQYALIREQLTKDNVYGTKYNWMTFKIDQDATEDSDMSGGFAAWDAQSNSGKLIGAGYSNKAQKLNWPDASDGISDINKDGSVDVDSFGTDSATKSLYFYSDGIPDWGHRVTLTGTQSGATILDFGPDAGGGSGLAIPQASSKDWNPAYNGTYFMMVYEYSSWSDSGPSDNGTSINPMKCVLSGTTTGYLEVFESNADTSTATPVFESSLTAIADLSADASPGPMPIIDQFGIISGMYDHSPDAAHLHDANECKGSFIASKEASGVHSIVFIMFDPQGRFGGFTMFEEQNDPPKHYAYRFGFTINDPNYSNSKL